MAVEGLGHLLPEEYIIVVFRYGMAQELLWSMVPAALIAFCWGRFRVTGGGPAEDLFNPIYEGCFDRILKLHLSLIHI